jgi:hypothetical protein
LTFLRHGSFESDVGRFLSVESSGAGGGLPKNLDSDTFCPRLKSLSLSLPPPPDDSADKKSNSPWDEHFHPHTGHGSDLQMWRGSGMLMSSAISKTTKTALSIQKTIVRMLFTSTS